MTDSSLSWPACDYEAEWSSYLDQLARCEARKGRPLLPSERDYFTRQFYAPAYRADLKRIAQQIKPEERAKS
jgi:hypothetical protein